MNRGDWWVIVHGVTNSQTLLKRLSTQILGQIKINRDKEDIL